MEKRKNETAVKDYTTPEGQVKVQWALILAMALLLTISTIRYNRLYSEMEENYRQLAESNQLLRESDRLILERYQALIDLFLKIQELQATDEEILK